MQGFRLPALIGMVPTELCEEVVPNFVALLLRNTGSGRDVGTLLLQGRQEIVVTFRQPFKAQKGNICGTHVN